VFQAFYIKRIPSGEVNYLDRDGRIKGSAITIQIGLLAACSNYLEGEGKVCCEEALVGPN
jgi:hypothetical protein